MIATSCQEKMDNTTDLAEEREVSIIANYTGDIQSRATAALDTAKSFYLYFNQDGGAEAFVKVKYDDGWKLYDATGTTETSVKYLTDGSTTTLAALDCGDATLDMAALLSNETLYTASGYDMLYASSISIDVTAVVTITFDHLLSQLGVKVDNELKDSAVTAISISGVYDSFTWNASTDSDFILSGETTSVVCTGSDSSYSAVMVPQSIDGAIITVTMSDDAVYNATISGDYTLTAGVKNTLTVNISDGTVTGDSSSTMSVAALSIASWDDDGDILTLSKE